MPVSVATRKTAAVTGSTTTPTAASRSASSPRSYSSPSLSAATALPLSSAVRVDDLLTELHQQRRLMKAHRQQCEQLRVKQAESLYFTKQQQQQQLQQQQVSYHATTTSISTSNRAIQQQQQQQEQQEEEEGDDEKREVEQQHRETTNITLLDGSSPPPAAKKATNAVGALSQSSPLSSASAASPLLSGRKAAAAAAGGAGSAPSLSPRWTGSSRPEPLFSHIPPLSRGDPSPRYTDVAVSGDDEEGVEVERSASSLRSKAFCTSSYATFASQLEQWMANSSLQYAARERQLSEQLLAATSALDAQRQMNVELQREHRDLQREREACRVQHSQAMAEMAAVVRHLVNNPSSSSSLLSSDLLIHTTTTTNTTDDDGDAVEVAVGEEGEPTAAAAAFFEAVPRLTEEEQAVLDRLRQQRRR